MVELTQTYIGLGSNLGDRVENLISARNHLANLPAVSAVRCSSLYVTSPMGYLDQPNFVNCALQLDFAGDAAKLFAAMQNIEQRLGRKRDIDNRNAPRLIDIDLLVFGETQWQSEQLTIPHPRLATRLFVLLPLAELNPSLMIPGHGPVTALIDQGWASHGFERQKIHKL